MKISIDNNEYLVDIIYKNNKNTYLRVKNGKIVVTTNKFTSKSSIIKLIKDNEKSIINMIDKDDKRQKKSIDFYYFGKKYDVIYGFSDIQFDADKVYVTDEKGFFKYLDKEIYRIFKERLDYWYGVFEENIPIPNMKIRKMTTRWGVCNIKNHNVTLNYMLYKYDITCLDYVIVHELSHFIHHNHSRDFWLLVSKYYPNYKEARKMLKE